MFKDKNSLGRGRCGAQLSIAVAATLLMASVTGRAEAVWFDIEAKPLPAALKDFAAQAKMQLLYAQGTVADVKGNAVVGNLEKQVALATLLRDTGLEAVYSWNGAATIRIADNGAALGEDGAKDGDRMLLAQAGRPSAPSGAPQDMALTVEEIIVVARRREESLQTVPIAVTVVSQDTLQNNNVATLENLRQLVPSMATSSVLSPDEINVSIRGQTRSNSRPGVILYLNEVPLPSDGGGYLVGGPGLFFDLENVQVLKGPQGTLFGRESVGGAVLLQTARPKNEFSGNLQVGYGNYDTREIDAAINVPIIADKLLTRFAFNGQKRDGYTRVRSSPDRPNGFDADNRDYWSVRGTVAFKPNDTFSNDTTVTYQHYENNGSPTFLVEANPTLLAGLDFVFPNVGFGTIPDLLAEQQALGKRKHIALDSPLRSKGTLLSISNITNVDITDDLRFRTILGYDRAVSYRMFDNDATILPISNQPRTTRRVPLQQYTVEAQLLGKAFDGRLEWIAGAFALRSPFEDYYLQTGTQFGFVNDSKEKNRTKSEALFAQGTYDLSSVLDGLKLTGGLRYTWDTSTRYNIGLVPGTDCTSVPPINCDESSARRAHAKSSALTWTTGLDYQVTPETLIYLASRRGYRAGGSNANPGVPVQSFDPEYVLDYELGLKSDWAIVGRPVRTNLAVFFQDYTDIQTVRTIFQGASTINFTDNAAKAELWGAEFEALFRLTDALELGASAAYLKLKYTDFDEDVSDATIGELKSREDASPSKTYTLSAQYRLPLPSTLGELSTQVNWSWQEKFTLAVNALGIMDVPSYGLLNLAMNWNGIGGSPVDASLFMTNALDKTYIIGGQPFLGLIGYNQARYGEPRMYGARVRYRFGGT